MTRPHRRARRAIPALGATAFLIVLGAASVPDGRTTGLPPHPAASIPRSSAWLARLPEGEAKRKFILDCTGCHQFDEKIARPAGVPRTEAQWVEAVTRMLGYAGATTSFPVISADREPAATAAWLARYLGPGEVRDVVLPKASPADIKEYLMPEAQDLPHDVAVLTSGDVLITGMFTHRLYRLDPTSGKLSDIAIPVEKANPRAINLDWAGRPWVVLGGPQKLAMLAADSQCGAASRWGCTPTAWRWGRGGSGSTDTLPAPRS